MKFGKTFNIALTVVIFAVMGFVLYRNISELKGYEFSLGWGSAIVSLIFLCAFFLLFALGWRLILKELGYSLGVRKALHIKFVSDIVRFLPGKLWYFARRAQMAKKEKVPYAITVYSVLLESLFGILASSLLFLVALLYLGSKVPSYIVLIALCVPLLYVVMNPKTINWIVNKGLKRFGRDPMELGMSVKGLLLITLFFLFTFSLAGIGFYFMANAVYSLPVSKLPLAAAVFLGSWVIGYFGIITPAGLGVREGALSFFLSFFMPVSIAILVSVVSRVWFMVGEGLVVVFFFRDC
ncbi:MAG: lysylphosphatidylglycerol synthase domain-containing protein [Candidatus Woesearchaeota archaeon]